MVFDWELLPLIRVSWGWAPLNPGRIQLDRHEDHDKSDSVLKAITLVTRGDSIELMTGRQYLERYYPGRGVKLVKFIIDAIDSSSDVSGKYRASWISSGTDTLRLVDDDTLIQTTDDQLIIRTSSDDPQLKCIATWLCLSFRRKSTQVNGSIWVSTGSFEGTRLAICEVYNVSTPTCWKDLFDFALVVVMPNEAFSASGLLKLSFALCSSLLQ